MRSIPHQTTSIIPKTYSAPGQPSQQKATRCPVPQERSSEYVFKNVKPKAQTLSLLYAFVDACCADKAPWLKVHFISLSLFADEQLRRS